MTGTINFEEIKRKAMNGQLTYEDAQAWVEELRRLSRETEQLLKMTYEATTDLRKRRKLYDLYIRFTLKNTSDLADKLREKGEEVAKDENIRSSFEKMGYRIMELARHGHRDIVFGMILRIFFAANKDIPEELSKIFQPVYPDDVFRTLLYSFLSGVFSVIAKTERKKEQGGEA